MPSLEVTNFLTSMKRKGEVLSIKGLDAQINAMMQVICLVEDEDSRIQFMRRIETVQKDLRCLRSKLESKMPGSFKRQRTLNIDHSRLLIGSSEEGYIPLTEKISQKVQDITQKIDGLSEGLVFIVQRHRDSRDSQSQVPRSKENGDRSDHPSHFDPYRDTQDKIQQTTRYSRGPNHEKSDNGSTYSFKHPKSDGSQVQTSFGRAGPYHHPSSVSQPYQHNQFIPTPNYLNSPTPTSTYLSPQSSNMQGHFDRFSTTSSSSSQLQASGNHSYENFTGYPSGNLSYFPDGRQSQQGGPSYQTSTMPWSPTGSPFSRIPADMSSVTKFSDTSSIRYRSEGSSSSREYPRNSQRTGARHGTHRN